MTENVIDETTDGRYRVLVEQDTDAMSPGEWDSSGMHVFSMEYLSFGYRVEHLAGPTGSPFADELITGIADALRRWGSDEYMLGRYLAEVHGGIYFQTYDRRGGGKLLAVVTHEHLAEWGGNVELIREADLLADWRAYDEGDVYGYVVQERATWQRVDNGAKSESGTMDTWENVDSCWGFFGYDYAVSSACEALAEVTANV